VLLKSEKACVGPNHNMCFIQLFMLPSAWC
jgi:hypothetical protein